MTRKRFVKLLMARKISRNEANELADRAACGRVSYEKAYMAYTSLPDVLDVIQLVGEKLQRVARAICDGMSAFVEAFASSLNRT
ncbi:MAG: hypothetical protein KHZ05_05425 [Oscillospiraceae bacterium]|nr:hypothetical protein [Oscillospiraceae bacterium]